MILDRRFKILNSIFVPQEPFCMVLFIIRNMVKNDEAQTL